MDGWLGVLIMIALGVGFAAVMIGLSLLLGPRNPTPEKLAPYECGMPAVGDARERQSVKYVWRKGVLDWGPAVRRIQRPDQQQRAA